MTQDAVRCVVCEATGARRDPYFYQWRGRQFWVHRCRTCTHQFVHPPITAEDQAAIYGDAYFSKDGDWVCGVFKTGYVEARSDLIEEARQILAMLPAPPGRLLDVGCAGGTFLHEARTRGFEVSGIELNPTMADYARRTYSLDVRCERIEDISPATWRAGFDIVTLLDVLEHLPRPLAAMRKISGWVRPGGCLFIRGPLVNSRLAAIKEGLRRNLGLVKQLPGYPLDANMFNKTSLAALLANSGFDVVAWKGQTASFSNLIGTRQPDWQEAAEQQVTSEAAIASGERGRAVVRVGADRR